MQYMLMLKMYKHVFYCALFQHYILVFGIAHVPRDRTDGIDDASLSLSVTLINLQMALDGYIDIYEAI